MDGLDVGDALPSERRAGGGARGVPADAAPGHRRARRRRPARPAARERHLRGRAPHRGVADHDLVHRGHAPARDEAGGPGAVVPHRARGGADRQAAGPVTGRRGIYHSAAPARGRRHHGHRDPLPAAGADPGPAPHDLEGRSFYELLRGHGVVIASGTETIEPTVTTAEEAAELDVPVHTPGVPVRAGHQGRGRAAPGVRPVRLPRRPVPAGTGPATPNH
ncbi:UTRA domain-containing protein [Actinomadura madurae]|nr:UTRA domain-containing protein [Actinomadura madurae]